MGAAHEHRGNALIRKQIDGDHRRPLEFDIMDRLNAVRRVDGAVAPFGPVVICEGHGGWWVESTTGYGFFYPTLRIAVAHWRVVVIGYDNGVWKAIPDRRS